MSATPPVIPRSRWTRGDSPAVPVKPSELEGVAIHDPGTPETIGRADEDSIARRLEGYRVMHVRDKGWRDIAYNVAVDQSGRVWVLRGISRQSGANGTSAANRAYGAVLVMVGNNEEPTPECIAAVQYAIRLYDVRFPGRIRRVRPHSAFKQTSCPGDALRRLLNDGRTLYVSGGRRTWPNVTA